MSNFSPTPDSSILSSEDFSRQLFDMERAFHKQLVGETDRERRKKLYVEFYERLTKFFKLHDPEKSCFGSFSPELMRLFSSFVTGNIVMDFGCGYGSATLDLAKVATKVIAADVSQPMIDRLREVAEQRKLTNVETVCLNDQANEILRRYDETLDVVYSNDVVEHLHPDDMDEHLAHMHRLLCPCGLYICITPNRVTGPHDVSARFLPYHTAAEGAHIREYSYRELCDVFRKNGFVKFRTPFTGMGYSRFRSDAILRRLLVAPQWKFWLESVLFEKANKHRRMPLNLFCINKVILFAWKA